jgi:hypothetical protein
MDDKEAGVMPTFLTSERAIDHLRWSAAFVAVVLTYGVAGWMLLWPASWQLDVNAPVVEINLPDTSQLSTIPPPGDRASERASPPTRPSADAAGHLPVSADAGGGSAGRAPAEAPHATERSADAPEQAAAPDKAEERATAQPRSPGHATPEVPPRTEAPPADSGGGARPIVAPPRLVTPGTSAAASVTRAPIDTSITVNQARSLFAGTKGGPPFRGLALPQLKLTPPFATLNASKKPNPLAGLALPATRAAVAAANHGHASDLVQNPAMGTDGGLARNAIGIVIEQRAVVPPAGAPLGVHPLPGAMSTAMHASGAHGPATTAIGAHLPAASASPRDTALSTGVANLRQASHSDRALNPSRIASRGGPAVDGTGMSRPASSTAAVGGPGHAVGVVLNGSGFRAKLP